ncbi:hypothetical protein [Bacteroides sp.]
MKEPFFRLRIDGFKGVPSHDTFNRVFSLLNPKEGQKDDSFESLRIVSTLATANGVSIGQEKVGQKNNEIKDIPKLIETLDIELCQVTIMGCL